MLCFAPSWCGGCRGSGELVGGWGKGLFFPFSLQFPQFRAASSEPGHS